ncbi:hypothetical protein AT959_13475 [Dechloromonas denitrificans]|uniref:N-acetyltransferase domain-containing protein n=1 Tax=Dechloromonas denitrificans TaxID=281362 RepID=A0A133XHD3_9RHOO|nr:GNAT family N-acetyltransferase [Dechloromonas denitrificans]KXB30350.1 hypothetical protein AT959_13475 [Dechloromonas denitrificans]
MAPSPQALSELARPRIAAHLLALDADDRHGRFSAVLSDAGIGHYVERIDFQRDRCLGLFAADGRLIAFIHLALHGHVAELAASVLAPQRRRGLARALFANALRVAEAEGIREVHLATGHPAARRICLELGYPVEGSHGYPRARILLGHRLAERAAA